MRNFKILYPKFIENVRTLINVNSKSQPSFSAKKEKVEIKPVITISREAGSGGRLVAEMVAKKLGFELFDEKLVEAVAKSAHLRKGLIKSIDERHRSAMTDMIQSLLNPDYVSDITYIKHVIRVILFRAHQGKVIILGRGANFIIPPDRILSVRIQAPYPIRVAQAIQHEKIDIDQAKQNIAKADAERKGFVRQYFNKNISNANYYDLVINTTHMRLEDACDLIIFTFKKKFKIKP